MKDWTELRLNRPLENDQVAVGVAHDGSKYAVCKIDDQVHVVENRCRHQGGPLGDGYLSGRSLTCPWHGWEYDVSDGSCKSADSQRPLEVFESRVEDSKVFIRSIRKTVDQAE